MHGRSIDMRCVRFDVDPLEPARASELRQPLSVVYVTLVDASRQYALCMTGADALARAATLNQAVV